MMVGGEELSKDLTKTAQNRQLKSTTSDKVLKLSNES